MIAIAGPYSAPTADQCQRNLLALNRAAAAVFKRGHIPIIGVNAALPVVELLDCSDRYAAIMKISLAVVSVCDAILMIGESPGAIRERALLTSQGKRVFTRLEDIPLAPETPA